MIKLEPYKIMLLADDCYCVSFGCHAGKHYEGVTGKALTENNHSADFEIVVKAQDSISAVIEAAKKKFAEVMPLLSI